MPHTKMSMYGDKDIVKESNREKQQQRVAPRNGEKKQKKKTRTPRMERKNE